LISTPLSRPGRNHNRGNFLGTDMTERPLSLTTQQPAEVTTAAGTLPVSERSDFLIGVAKRLGPEPTTDAVLLAISLQLKVNQLPQFVCNAKPEDQIEELNVL
jgi:hypothetical protein